MRRRTLGAACLIGIAVTAAAKAWAADDALLLRYHFQPGQEYRYRITMSGDMATSIGGITAPAGAAVPGKIPSTMNGIYELVQKVKSVSPEGVATVSVAMDKMELTTAVMGMNIVARLGAGGKLETLMNGQPAPFPTMANTALPNPLYEIKIAPAGNVTRAAPDASNATSGLFGGQNMSALFNSDMPGVGMLALPEKPVKPGDTWDTQRDVQVPVAMAMPGLGGGGPGGPASSMRILLKTSVHSKLLRVENGRAVIETQVTATTPSGAKPPPPGGVGAATGPGLTFEKMDQSMSGTVRLNIEQGVIEGGDNDIKLAMVIAMGLPAGVPGAGPGVRPGSNTGTEPVKQPNAAIAAAAQAPAPSSPKISVDGTIKMKIERLTAPPAAPAP
jgi:hypothetical protein